MSTGVKTGILICVLLLLTGCSTLATVQPWEKGFLAKAEMQFQTQGLELRYAQHQQASREAAAGGASVGGGGCGCN